MCRKPVNNFPGIWEVGNDLNVDEYFLLNVDYTYHLVKEFPSVCKELFHLKVHLKLMELLHLATDASQATFTIRIKLWSVIFFLVFNVVKAAIMAQ